MPPRVHVKLRVLSVCPLITVPTDERASATVEAVAHQVSGREKLHFSPHSTTPVLPTLL